MDTNHRLAFQSGDAATGTHRILCECNRVFIDRPDVRETARAEYRHHVAANASAPRIVKGRDAISLQALVYVEDVVTVERAQEILDAEYGQDAFASQPTAWAERYGFHQFRARSFQPA